MNRNNIINTSYCTGFCLQKHIIFINFLLFQIIYSIDYKTGDCQHTDKQYGFNKVKPKSRWKIK